MLNPVQIQGQRFSCVRDSQGLWIVWDQWDGKLASLGSQALNSLPEDRALAAFDILERIYASRRDASSLQRH
jgi:hypothetical protein